jgi:hypothetical protein
MYMRNLVAGLLMTVTQGSKYSLQLAPALQFVYITHTHTHIHTRTRARAHAHAHGQCLVPVEGL